MIRALMILVLLSLAACERDNGARGFYVGGGAGASRTSD